MKGAILDRDGTLIDFHRDAEIGAVVTAFHPSQLRLLPGVIEGLVALRDAGFTLAIATNQPGPAKGQVKREDIERTNRALVSMLAESGVAIASTATCFHHPEGGPGGDPSLARACDCRKPAPGLLLKLGRELGLDPSSSWMIGDSHVDLEAARAAGMRAALVLDTRRCELCPFPRGEPGGRDCGSPDVIAPRFDAVVAAILRAS